MTQKIRCKCCIGIMALVLSQVGVQAADYTILWNSPDGSIPVAWSNLLVRAVFCAFKKRR